ncbi:hypothetical protein F4779DRAFT_435245 [Xylariaceae sp. FL0662B]|nr:hypothetical protein F4779DRAFT_435245 [Xylariaceae sp. FL0662B]
MLQKLPRCYIKILCPCLVLLTSAISNIDSRSASYQLNSLRISACLTHLTSRAGYNIYLKGIVQSQSIKTSLKRNSQSLVSDLIHS